MAVDDVELTQAQAMMRRVSPEGRALARREAAARARVRNRIVAQVALAAVAALLLVWLMSMVIPVAPTVYVGAAIGAAAVVARVAMRLKARDTATGRLAVADLPALPAATGRWLDAQRPSLPAPAIPLADQLQRRLDGLAPQLVRVPAADPAADAVHKLLATELPGLVDGWRAVPPTLRGRANADGLSADAHLLDGLRLIDAEMGRMTEQLARGALDEVATQGRYLELKYRDGA